MEYFQIKGKDHPLGIQLGKYKSSIQEKVEKEEEVVLYYEGEEQIGMPILSVQGYIFVEDHLKKILTLYEEDKGFKQVLLLNPKEKESKKYWLCQMEPLDCYGKSTKFGVGGRGVQELVLAEPLVKEKDVFIVSMLKGSNNPYITKRLIVSLRVCESILRRHMVGIEYKKVETEEV
jgi:hypothetical protein